MGTRECKPRSQRRCLKCLFYSECGKELAVPQVPPPPPFPSRLKTHGSSGGRCKVESKHIAWTYSSVVLIDA